jgi:PadR family transcriptional regulator PadR
VMVPACDATGARAGLGDCCAANGMASRQTAARTPAVRIAESIEEAPTSFPLDLRLVRSIITGVNEALPKFSATERLIVELLTEHEELFGLQMVELTGGRLKRGTVYVTLGRMQEKGYLESRQEPLPPGAIGLPRRLYRPTGFALRALAAWKAAEQMYLHGPEFQEG